MHNDETALSGNINKGIMELNLTLGKSTPSNPRALETSNDSTILHSRLGHPGSQPFLKIHPAVTPPDHCEPCILAKTHRLPYTGKFEIAKGKLDLIHSNLSGIITPPSLGGRHYFFKLTDSCTS